MVVAGLLAKIVIVAASSPLFGPVAVPVAPAPAAVGPTAAVSPAQPAAGCAPSKVLDLTNWKVTLPLAKPDNPKSPLEILQPELAGYSNPVFFRTTPACDAILFQAPVTGVTTSGSKNPRSELREMTDGGTGLAGWSSGAGTHRMTVTQAFTHLPNARTDGGTAGLVGAQIHDADDDITVIRLEGSNLWVTEGDNPHYKLITDKYKLGTKFETSYEVGGGKVEVFYNGELQATIADRFRGAYFKTGAYTQANCTNSLPCAATNYGETAVYSVSVFHQVTTGDLIWDWIFTFVPPVLLALVVLFIAYRLFRGLRNRRRPARHGR
jgi:hypothetical protein